MYSDLAIRSSKLVVYRTNTSYISLRAGRMVMARPVARTFMSLPNMGKYLLIIYTMRDLFLVLAWLKKEKMPMQAM